MPVLFVLDFLERFEARSRLLLTMAVFIEIVSIFSRWRFGISGGFPVMSLVSSILFAWPLGSFRGCYFIGPAHALLFGAVCGPMRGDALEMAIGGTVVALVAQQFRQTRKIQKHREADIDQAAEQLKLVKESIQQLEAEMSASSGLAFASEIARGPKDLPGVDLTERENRVLYAICEGKQNKQIAVETGVSEASVKGTIQRLYFKLGVEQRTRAALVRIAFDHRTVSPQCVDAVMPTRSSKEHDFARTALRIS